MTLCGLPLGAGSSAAAKKDEMTLNGDSLFSMALFRSEQQPQQQAPPAAVETQNNFYAVDEFKGHSLRDLLDLSDDCLFGDEDTPAAQAPHSIVSAPLCTSMLPGAPTVSPPSQEDIEWQQLEDPPITSLMGAMDLPVAAALVGSMDQELCAAAAIPQSTNPRKRSLAESFLGDYEQDGDDLDRRFRPYQSGQWTEKFDELVEYRKTMGHCLVPHTYHENLPLARWVKRQRYQFKLMKEGKSSTMTPDRVRALEEIGFIWDSQGAAWSERLEELRQYRMRFGHCNVPSNYSENPQLATWVKCQRRQYKLYQEQKPSNMTAVRIEQLNVINFEWELRSYKKARIC
eukprot:CAMPEP_0168732892 /NCGR_PEP_ID=MMETSP0724-20121128/8001_1 /TAXON_ID=265536 /ORGANISM="Amphiprora sp., Strain CCMP467" /LENGTH=343 /DNA_ID=CAMNT_0008779917 /DNA_START=113 /DNA_END=1144 /DNA_ORIENTATION=-